MKRAVDRNRYHFQTRILTTHLPRPAPGEGSLPRPSTVACLARPRASHRLETWEATR